MLLGQKFSKILRDILLSCQDSLNKLALQPIGVLENFRMLPLQNVEFLSLEVLDNPFQNLKITCAHMFFRKSSDFTSAVFPNLKTVRFGMNLKGQYAVRYFPWDNPDSDVLESIHTVDYVEVVQKLDVYALRFITAKFPKITKLKLEHTRYSCRMDCHIIWKFLPENLQHLELYEDALSLDCDGYNQQFALDSVFTGFSEKTCGVLRQFRHQIHAHTLVKRQKATICDLRGLKTLRFTFASPQSYTKRTWFSEISGKYAFSLMPELQVIIAYDMLYPKAGDLANGLQLIAPFVRFEHREIRDDDS
ncbi:unnamed protein product [Allacma fusca]|uniref:Uncharacterized protein n=1 Tax=Allacma fusca TaxID=39272 RepID=A0A8J2JN80_9HEXA|nr:unnamed protein product [Allacma fusca]